MVISLGCRSPGTSSNLPGNIGRAALKRFPIWSCSGWGFPCLACHHASGGLLPRLFTLTTPKRGGMFSVALSRGRPRFVLRTILPCGVRTFLWPLKGPATMRPLQTSFNCQRESRSKVGVFLLLLPPLRSRFSRLNSPTLNVLFRTLLRRKSI